MISQLHLFVMLIALAGCQSDISSNGTLEMNSQKNPGDLDQSSDDPIDPLYGKRALQIKTHEELKQSFQVLTGINVAFPLIAQDLENYYSTNKASLPQSNNPNSLGPSQIVAIQNYAAEFCRRTVEIAGTRAEFYANTPFAQTGQTNQTRDLLLGTPELRRQLADHIIAKLWKPSTHPSRAESREELVKLIDNLFSSSPQNNEDNGKGIVIAACTAGLSAITVIAQ